MTKNTKRIGCSWGYDTDRYCQSKAKYSVLEIATMKVFNRCKKHIRTIRMMNKSKKRFIFKEIPKENSNE